MLVNCCAKLDNNRIWVEQSFGASVEMLPAVSAFIEEALENLSCPMKVILKMAIAIEEIYVNIVQYGYDNKGGEVVVGVGFLPEDGTVAITFIDQGIPFNPLEKDDPDVTLPAEKRRIGGLGIFMVKQIADDVLYENKDGENILTIIKKIKN